MISDKIVEKFNLHMSHYQLGEAFMHDRIAMLALALSGQDTTAFVADCDTAGLPLPDGRYLVLCNWNYHSGDPVRYISFFEATEEFLLDQHLENIKYTLNAKKMVIKLIEPVAGKQKPEDLKFQWDFKCDNSLRNTF